MKKTLKRISLLLLLALLITVLPLTTFAAPQSFAGTVGVTETFWFHLDYDDVVTEAQIENGDVPGMYLHFPNPAAVTLSGMPSQSGNYTLYISVYTESGNWLQYTLNIDIKDAPKPTEAPTEPAEKPSGKPIVINKLKITKHPTGEKVIEGDSAMFIARADNVQQYVWEIAIADAVLDVSKLASYLGVNVSVSGANSDTLIISNIPKALDDAYVRCRFQGAEEVLYSEYAKITVTPLEKATPAVTKSPTDETVNEGGQASFVAKGKYILGYQWKLEATNGKVYTCADAPKTFSGLQVSGASSETLTLSNIPAELDGARIYCEFTAGVTVATEKAKLTVIPKPTEAPTEAPIEPATEAPTEAPTAPATEAPSSEVTEASSEPESTEEFVPSQDDSSTGNSALIITIIISLSAVAVAGIAAFVILKLYGKKR